MLEKMKELCQKKMDATTPDNAHGHCLLEGRGLNCDDQRT